MATILVSLLQRSKTISQIHQIHAQLITRSLISEPFLANSLLFAICVTSNPSCSDHVVAYAELVFSEIRQPNNTFAWNTFIRFFHSVALKPRRAVLCFVQMGRNGVARDSYTYPFALKGYGSMMACRGGMAVHGEVIKRGFDSDAFVGNSLISLYCRCGELAIARRVFDGFLYRDLVSWNSIIAGCVSSGEMGEAQRLFDEMPERDAFSWAILIDGYGKKTGDIARARELFDEMSDGDLVCWNTMLDGYASLGMMGPARELFESMHARNVISWSIVIDGYVRHGDPKEALSLFQLMLRLGTKPDKVSVVGVFSACGQLGALDQGRWLHSYLDKNRMLFDVVVQTALIDMYMKCGSLDVARRVFESMKVRSVVTWNVMLVGLGMNGFGGEALDLFYKMKEEGAFMDDLSFIGVLTACVHAGLVDQGLEIFNRMTRHFAVEPKVEHYGCVVDLLGRAGRLAEARNVLETMPMKPTAALWGSLLAACRTHRVVHLAEHSVDRLASLGADDSSVYVLLSMIYAKKAMWDDVWRVRRLMFDRGMKKESGRSVIEVEGSVHDFVNGDCSHALTAEIREIIWNLSRMMTLDIRSSW